MNYEFPTNITIDEVRSIIKDRPEFIEANRGDHIIFNYNVNFPDTFPPVIDRETAILRELRGLIFDAKSGLVCSRRFQKFFNMNEREETKFENIDWSKRHWVMEKLDGSMVTPYAFAENYVRWFSKMGETFVSEQIEKWLSENKIRQTKYEKFAIRAWMLDETPIFEWITPDNRIVIDYKEPNLILTAIRDNKTGEYLTSERFTGFAKHFDIPVVDFFESEHMGTIEYLKTLETNEADEGVVIRFEDGHMIKVKTAWYIQLHKVKSYLDQEKDIAKLILENNIDDLMAVLSEDDRKRVETYSLDLSDALMMSVEAVYAYIQEIASMNITKKEYAINYSKLIDLFFRNFTFRHYDRLKEVTHAEIEETIVAFVLTKTGSNANFIEAKEMLGWDLKW